MLPEYTDEKGWGWIIYYRAKDPKVVLAGNAPYFVNRENGEIRVSGTAFPIEHYVKEYEAELNNWGGGDDA